MELFSMEYFHLMFSDSRVKLNAQRERNKREQEEKNLNFRF